MPEETAKCSRCEGSLDTMGTPRWCKACRAEYQREYQELRRDMATGKGFAAGAEQMRRAMVEQLAKLNPAALTNFNEMLIWIRDFPSPRP